MRTHICPAVNPVYAPNTPSTFHMWLRMRELPRACSRPLSVAPQHGLISTTVSVA
jgi:hypothetical protein